MELWNGTALQVQTSISATARFVLSVATDTGDSGTFRGWWYQLPKGCFGTAYSEQYVSQNKKEKLFLSVDGGFFLFPNILVL